MAPASPEEIDAAIKIAANSKVHRAISLKLIAHLNLLDNQVPIWGLLPRELSVLARIRPIALS
jgi:hypothetical protein